MIGAYSSYLFLFAKMDQALREEGRLDPLTWIEVDAQVQEDPRLHAGQRAILHNHAQNVLRRANGGWG